MPTGVALRDAHAQLLAAGNRVLLRDGPAGLTSRAVTDEAGVAKGVLHRHFDDFDHFLATLVEERGTTLVAISLDLSSRVGSGTVIENVQAALRRVFDPLGLAIIRLVLTHDEVRSRLGTTTPHGIPTLVEAVAALTDYLLAEQHLGRILPTASPRTLAQTLIGTGHLLFAGELGGLPDESAVHELVATSLVSAEPSTPT